MAKVDMHCHSKKSGTVHHWVWAKVGALECYISPQDLYTRMKSRGMDFVTITDHDTIDGARELADSHADAFVSCEFTVRFPNEKVETHICAYDISPEQFRMGRRLAGDLYALAEYFRSENVLTVVPHALYDNFNTIGIEHLERLLLLFDHFEQSNGLLLPQSNAVQKRLLDTLTQERIAALVRKHGIDPAFARAWDKGRTCGSDDHSGYFLGTSYTEVAGARDWREFLDGVRQKRSRAHGRSTTAFTFAHSVHFNVIDTIAQIGDHGELPLLERAEASMRLFCGERSGDLVGELGEISTGKGKGESVKERLVRLITRDWQNADMLLDGACARDLQEESFEAINQLFNLVVEKGVSDFVRLFKKGRLVDSLSRLAVLAPTAALVIPYVQAVQHIHADRAFREKVAERFNLEDGDGKRPEKWGWFTDTIVDVNGVARTIQTVGALAEQYGTPVTTLTCHPGELPFKGKIKNFKPVYQFNLPEYESMLMSIPPLLDMLHYCEKQQFTRFIISTPGPVGFMAMAVAKILGIQTVGIYHTDLPNYARILTGDFMLEQAAWWLVRVFYGNVDQVYVLTEAYRDMLVQNGLHAKDIRIFPKGTDVDLYHPDRRKREIWEQWGLGDGLKLIYVGRVSREKDLDILRDAWLKIRQQREDIDLVIVGEGPYLSELKANLADTRGVVFTGFVEGEDLAELFASADIFAFPSTTDTYGSVVLEAQASGLPAVVSDKGGPQEVIRAGVTGVVSKGRDVDDFAAAIMQLANDDDWREEMAYNARLAAEDKSWEAAFRSFWAKVQNRPDVASIVQLQTAAHERKAVFGGEMDARSYGIFSDDLMDFDPMP